MSEETVEELVATEEAKENPVQEAEKKTPELSVEERAQQLGWKNEDEYSGPRDKWISADDFIKKGENELPVLKDNLRRIQKELSSLKSGMDEYRAMTQATNNRLREQLEKAKIEAVEEGDVEKYKELDAQSTELAKAEIIPQTDSGQKAVEDFIARNPWSTQPTWRARTEIIDSEVAVEHPGLAPEEHMKIVEERLKERFADDFGNKRRKEPSAVATTRRRTNHGNVVQLTEEQQKYFEKFQKMFKKMGREYTKEEYIKELKA